MRRLRDAEGVRRHRRGYHRDDRHVPDHRPAHSRTCPSGKRKRRWKAGSASTACGGRPSRSAPSSRRAWGWPSRSRSHSSNPALGRPLGAARDLIRERGALCGSIHRPTRPPAGDPAGGARERRRAPIGGHYHARGPGLRRTPSSCAPRFIQAGARGLRSGAGSRARRLFGGQDGLRERQGAACKLFTFEVRIVVRLP